MTGLRGITLIAIFPIYSKQNKNRTLYKSIPLVSNHLPLLLLRQVKRKGVSVQISYLSKKIFNTFS